MGFRERLRDQIDFLGLLDKEVADKAGISKRAIDSYVGNRGCIPSAEVAVKLAQVLNTSVEYLVTGKTSEPTPTPPELQHLQQFDSKEEKKLIKAFSKLSSRDKGTIVSLAEHLAAAK